MADSVAGVGKPGDTYRTRAKVPPRTTARMRISKSKIPFLAGKKAVKEFGSWPRALYEVQEYQLRGAEHLCGDSKLLCPNHVDIASRDSEIVRRGLTRVSRGPTPYYRHDRPRKSGPPPPYTDDPSEEPMAKMWREIARGRMFSVSIDV